MFFTVKEEDESVSKDTKIDITSIIKDVENCIKVGLDEKLNNFFCDYERYEKTHNEVLNLTIVKNLKNHNNALQETILNIASTRTTLHGVIPKNESEVEINSLKKQVYFLKEEVDFLRDELNKYISTLCNSEDALLVPSAEINLEIKEKLYDCNSTCNGVDSITNICMDINNAEENIVLTETKKHEEQLEEEYKECGDESDGGYNTVDDETEEDAEEDAE